MKISICIMAHYSRSQQVEALYYRLRSMPFSELRVSIDWISDEWPNGQSSWEKHTDADWHVVIQDDAIIGENFYKNIESALTSVPEKTMVSFYTGKARPKAEIVTKAVKKADEQDASWLAYKNLLWGVCVAMPTDMIDIVIREVQAKKLPYDYRLGSYFKNHANNVYYSHPSLVDHNDSLPSLTGHDKGNRPRVAHRYSNDLVEFNSKVVEI